MIIPAGKIIYCVGMTTGLFLTVVDIKFAIPTVICFFLLTINFKKGIF